ncbi:MAG TPA: hypothetical protein VMU87_11670 [Stellaceae bacterium]|nr:hypothetical protein [Stellaceae bacterium]
MSSLAHTIREAMARLGPETGTRLREIVAEFCALQLGEEDQLSALATSLATVAALNHARHKPVYLEAVRTWALEVSGEIAPPPLRLALQPGTGLFREGADILISGLDGLLDNAAKDAALVQDRLVLELTLFAQLLGQYDANAIHRTLMAVSDALADTAYRAGRAVGVPLDDVAVPLGRDISLAAVVPRGFA